MKRVVSLAAVSMAALILTTGCSIKNGADMSAHTSEDATICKTAIYVGHRSFESVLEAIAHAGKKEGWRMTAFKSNAILAEKEMDGVTRSTTIIVAKEHIMCSKDKLPQGELDALRAAIVQELKHQEKH